MGVIWFTVIFELDRITYIFNGSHKRNKTFPTFILHRHSVYYFEVFIVPPVPEELKHKTLWNKLWRAINRKDENTNDMLLNNILNKLEFFFVFILSWSSSNILRRISSWNLEKKEDVENTPDEDNTCCTEIIINENIHYEISLLHRKVTIYLFESCKNIWLNIPFPGKYMVSSLTEYCVPGIARKHWNTVSGFSCSTCKSLLTDTSNKPSFSTVNVVVSPLSWYL